MLKHLIHIKYISTKKATILVYFITNWSYFPCRVSRLIKMNKAYY